MGMMYVNGKAIVTPAEKMTAAEIKDLAGIPRNERLYEKGGKVLDDDDVIPTEGRELGAVTHWDRG